MTPPPASQGVVKQGAAQLQTVPQAQEAEQLVVTPLQVTCPRSFAPQLRSTAEQLPAPEQLTVVEPPQLAVQELFVGKGCLAARTAPSGATGLAGGLVSAGAGLWPGACAKPAMAIKAARQTKMLAFIMSLLF